MTALRLILTFHNHQPVGNFDGVCEAAYQDAYKPLLDMLEDFPNIPVVLHNSGSLLEWLAAHRPEYIDRVRAFVKRGQAEILGGPYFEPILAAIPRVDRIGQIASYKSHLEQVFETRVRGAWIPERVWEQSFAGDLADAGMEYTLLDDSHFRNAGMLDHELHGYYLTEESGRMIKVFAGSERMRYLLPYSDPQEVVSYLRGIAEQHPGSIVIFGDDGEKFGVWPGSQEHVYGEGWFRRFFAALDENRDWLKVTTMAETVDNVAPLGRRYLPDASYREMMEWALPADRLQQYQQGRESLSNHYDWHRLQSFVRAGFWRNFLVKYSETNEMYCRMLQVSQQLEALSREYADEQSVEMLRTARADLYRAQCNCPYWHGAFGGLYLPHLRNAVYRHLIAADTLLQQVAGRYDRWVDVESGDYNADARREVKLASDQLVAFVSPAQGGMLYELDLRSIRHNLLATLNRRPEAYHDKIRQHAGEATTDGTGGGVDPNGKVHFKQAGLDQKLSYDRWPRKMLVDHFLQPGLTLENFQKGSGCLSDFAHAPYEAVLRKGERRVEVQLSRDGQMGPFRVRVQKTVVLAARSAAELTVRYELSNLPAGLPIHFASEFNFAGMPGGASDRYFYDDRGRQVGLLDSQQSLKNQRRIGLVDEWLGIDVGLECSQPTQFWTMPIQTVSQSEGGFELVHQSSAVLPHWEFFAPADGRWCVELTLSIDTSAAKARQWAETLPADEEVATLMVV